jgi:murein DD-endopeptidase MepM/ murein hydrolase activator NlpD
MRAVILGIALSLALVAVGATGSTRASADDLDSARQRLAELRANLEEVTDRYLEARSRLIELNDTIEVRAGEIEEQARSLLRFQKDAEELAVELYKGGGPVTAIESVLSSKTMADVNRTTAYLQFSGEDQQRVIERIANDTADLEYELDLLDAQREEAQQTLEEIEEIQAVVERDAAQVQNEVAALEEQAAAEARAAELAAERRAAEAAAAQATETIVQQPPPPPSPPPPPPSSEADWDAIAMCESGGNWHIDSTYDGGLQFHPQTWLGYGGGVYARYAWQATREQQIAIAEKVLAGQGPGAWPNCFVWK